MSDSQSDTRSAKALSRRDVLVGAAVGSAVLASTRTTDASAAGPQTAPDGGIARYTALALQLACDSVNRDDPQSARQRIARSIERFGEAVRDTTAFLKVFNGRPVKLVVLPEYFLTGFPLGESFAEWKSKAALDPDGPEYESLGRIAQSSGVYLSGNAYETDPHFPELYFQTSFIIAPSGDLILRYRRLISLYTPTPYDVWDKYVARYGLDGVFPVVDTEIGRLACIASEEILYPELARCLAMRGAEIFCHSSSEVGSVELTMKDLAKRARALENLAYVVSANTAGIRSIGLPESSTDGMSKVVGPRGEVLDAAGFGESQAAGKVDVSALRSERSLAGMTNLLARQPFQAYYESYRDFEFLPANTLASIPRGQSAQSIARQRLTDTIARIDSGQTRRR
ncbi:MAG: nitrilase-related carbon-nitrogen hydrolase [Gammaproteobacteria bacterium]